MRMVSRVRAAAVAAVCVAGAAVAVVPAAAHAATAATRPSVTKVANVKDGAPSGGMSGGAVVTISGKNFVKHHTSVTVGGKPVRSLNVLSATRLRVTVRAHSPAIVAVQVHTPAGTSAFTSGDRFMYQYRQTLAAGFGFGCRVVASSEIAQCWGAGDLGNGTTTGSTTPVRVKGLTQVVSIAAGRGHACALTAAGAMYCWGDGLDGALGDGTTKDRSTPVRVKDLGRVVSIAVGPGNAFDSCAIVSGGRVECWGYNNQGQLGNGTTTKHYLPQPVKGLSSVVSLGLGVGFSCATKAAGTEFCWGRNELGQLGIGTTGARHITPVQVPGIHQAVTTVVGSSACIVTRSRQVRCWGPNYNGELGIGTTDNDVTRPRTLTALSGVTKLAFGNSFACALSGGQAFCWGDNEDGQLGDGTTIGRDTPTAVAGGLTKLTTILASYGDEVSDGDTGGMEFEYVLTARSDGTAWAWGDNTDGELGNTSVGILGSPTPLPVG